MTIGKKISGGYVLILLFTFIVAVTGLYILKTSRDSYRSFIDINQQLVLGATELRVSVLKQVEGYRSFLLFGEEPFLKTWNEGSEEFESKMAELQRLVTNLQEQRTLEEIALIKKEWHKLQE
ncbi:MAG: CHASE3 domain-containing protein, partial [Acidobacteriota bacterium]